MPNEKKLTIEDLQAAQSPEDLSRILSQGSFEAMIPDAPPENESIEESMLVPPSEIERRAKEIRIKENNNTLPSGHSKNGSKAGKVQINFETEGRFDIPDIAWFADYTVQDVNDIALSREEDILENLVNILNKLKDGDFKVEDMLLEEFYETLVGMKMQFNTTMHTHRWLCECQNDQPDAQRKFSETEIDLSSLRFVSINECDEEIKNHFKSVFEKVSDEQFLEYQTRKYGAPTFSREAEIEQIQVKEPIIIKDEDSTFEFRFTRVGDLLKGIKLGAKKFNWKIRQKKNESAPSLSSSQIMNSGEAANSIVQMQMNRKEQIEALEAEKSKYVILSTRAMSLLSFNGKILKNDEERVQAFSNMKRSTMIKFASISERVKFGIQDERDLTCNLCGKTDRRALQRSISPVELLPFDDSNRPVPGRKLQQHSELDIYFGT